MTKKFWVWVLYAVLGGLALSGCATYGVGFATMTGEAPGKVPELLSEGMEVSGLKQAFTSFSVFGSNEYSEFSVGTLTGTMDRTGTPYYGREATENMNINGWMLGTYVKYPFYLLDDRLTLFPMLGADIHGYGINSIGFLGMMSYLKVGGGLDFTFSKSFFLRGRAAYTPFEVTGMTFGISIGFRTAEDPVKSRYKTGTQIQFERLQRKAKDAQTPEDWRAVVDGYAPFIAKEPANAAYYFARSEAYLGMQDYDAAVKDLNKGAELGVILPDSSGQPQKWRELYRAYREAKGEEAPMDGRAIVIVPNSSHLQLVVAKTPGLKGAQGSGSEAMLKAGRQELVFRYKGALKDLPAMTVGDCALTFTIQEGHVYTAIAGFNGRDYTIRMNDVTARETGLDEGKEGATAATFTANTFYTGRFKKGMTLGALRRSGFPETWKSSSEEGTYATGIGSGNLRMAFTANFGTDGLFAYGLGSWIRYKNEMVDLLTNACGEPIATDTDSLSWISSEGLIFMNDSAKGDIFSLNIMPFDQD
jgi:hypothetical protein